MSRFPRAIVYADEDGVTTITMLDGDGAPMSHPFTRQETIDLVTAFKEAAVHPKQPIIVDWDEASRNESSADD